MQRKSELSFLNIIFCLLVIFIHTASAPVTELSKESWQYAAIFVPWRLSAFVVQGFIFLSGLKAFLKEDKHSYYKYLSNKFTKIICPYIFMVILFYAYFLWRDYFPFDIKDIFVYILKGDLVSHFYFIVVIVQFYLLRPVWTFIVNKISPKIAITASIIIMFLCKYGFSAFQYNDRIFTTYLAYWVMGCYAGKNHDRMICHIKKHKKVYISWFAVIALFEAIASYTQFAYGGLKFIEELHFIYCLSAILAVLSVATIASGSIMSKKFFVKIDNASYYIYLCHPLFIFITDGFLERFEINDIATGFIIRCIVTYSFSVMLSVAYSVIKKRNKNVRV